MNPDVVFCVVHAPFGYHANVVAVLRQTVTHFTENAQSLFAVKLKDMSIVDNVKTYHASNSMRTHTLIKNMETILLARGSSN